MTKRKRFAISQALTQGLSATINMVENNDGIFHNAIIPIERLELDPDNPRQLALSIADIKVGLKESDINYTRKAQELETITRLADTIKQRGLIQPIAVYKLNDRYRVVAGNRRCLAAMLADKIQIEARVFNHKPKAEELKIVQWIENTAREDLSLAEKLGNLQVICEAMAANKPDSKMTASTLATLTGLSLTQAKYYWRVLRSGEELINAIRAGWVTSLDKAALIAQVPQASQREQLIQACQQGKELGELRHLIKRQQVANQYKKPLANKIKATISLGSTTDPQVAKQIFTAVTSVPAYRELAQSIGVIDWSHYKSVAMAFTKLIKLLEEQMRGVRG